ncbi:ferric reductase-like transmembrane domain-containing protein [Streptomyces sp. NPDC058284]|uniref:ferredoxin reductase family protein n=1 Tax=unclassified Streptomyces TaxID=2593676 RepID=UPI00364D5780
MTTEAADPRLDAYPALAAYLRQLDATPDPGIPPMPEAPPRVPPQGAPRRPGGRRRGRRATIRATATATAATAAATATTPALAPPLRVPPRTLRTGILGGGLVVTALWAAQVAPSARLDALFATGAHLTGLLAGYGILVMLFLMARVPAVEHGVGADRLARLHALGGRYVLGLCAAHALLAVCGYAAHTGTDPLRTALGLLGYPGIAAATTGTALLAAVGATSARALRRRVPHEIWRAAHQLTYLGAALAFAHQLAGPDLADGVLTRWFWSLAHATVAVLLAWYRVVVPVRQALRHSLRVVDVRSEGPGVVSVLVQGIGVDQLRAEPGQFFRWRFLRHGLWHTALPFSLSAPVRDDLLRITVKAAGDHTRRMRRLRPGTRVLATGPFGALTAHRRTRRKVLLLAGGVGITPLRALFETLPGGPGDITLLYRAGSAGQLVLRQELEAIAERRRAGLHFLLGPSDAAFTPLAPQALRNLVPDLAEHDVYLCGPPGMSAAATVALVRAGVPEEHIHAERFTF